MNLHTLRNTAAMALNRASEPALASTLRAGCDDIAGNFPQRRRTLEAWLHTLTTVRAALVSRLAETMPTDPARRYLDDADGAVMAVLLAFAVPMAASVETREEIRA